RRALRNPAVAPLGHPAQRRLGGPADPNWDALLVRSRGQTDLVVLEELAGEPAVGVGEGGSEGVDALVGAFPSRVEVDAEGLELSPKMPGSDPEIQAAAGE